MALVSLLASLRSAAERGKMSVDTGRPRELRRAMDERSAMVSPPL
jgi:hypothetical protein